MELTGKTLSEVDSSFVEFEIKKGTYSKQLEETLMDSEEKSCYESIWMGEGDKAGFNSGSILICFDEMQKEDYQLLEENLHHDEYGKILSESENY